MSLPSRHPHTSKTALGYFVADSNLLPSSLQHFLQDAVTDELTCLEEKKKVKFFKSCKCDNSRQYYLEPGKVVA